MKPIRFFLTLTALSSLLLAACENEGPLEPTLLELSFEGGLALQLLEDPNTIETALELADIQSSAAQRRGWAWGSNNNARSQAEHNFREAQGALAVGDQVRAMERAREGRRLVAQSMAAAGGSAAILGTVERLEALPLMVTADQESFTNSGKLGLQLGKLATMAREAIRAGDQTRAGALGVLAEQAFRHNHRWQHQVEASRAEIAVALGAEAVELAKRVLSEQGDVTDTEQGDLLATAEAFLVQAQRALEAGEEARAAHLAHQAQWWALKAVILPGGITDEDARSVLTLAERLLDGARSAVGPEPTQLQAALLTKAARMLEHGKTNLSNGNCRGIGALWQSAVISSYLIG